MGYHHLAVDDIEPTPDRPSIQRSISDAADLENVAVNLYEVAPGEDIPLAYHYHDDQEELFYVLSGTLAVETPEKTYEVGANEAFVAEPDSPQRAHNPESATEPVRTLVVGAPAVDDVHPYDPE
ncbi:cupin domain-containing protein [Haloarcula argentinensis]|uniref:Cupin domain-containing protein n=1 Tax=Haloarcula argentinensis TaxID=43776 RepID=A0A847UHE2_HALAR|nr:cupin domain-containing protein [Haloarcula argentinensis]NLV13105.1 cupin domain-containing protein [Haloarcula argentinensis]